VDKVVGAFYKDSDAIERIFTKEYILSCEKSGKNCIDRLLLDCPVVTNKIMLTPDEEGKLLLHTFSQEHENVARDNTPFGNINETYSKRNQLDKSAEMYLTKDSNGKYPLDYIKDKDEKIQENALKIVKKTFNNRPELLEKILKEYDANIMAEEREIQEKIEYALEHGTDFTDKDGNRIHIKLSDRGLIRNLITGKVNFVPNMDKLYAYKKYSTDGRILLDHKQQYYYITYEYDQNGNLINKVTTDKFSYHGKSNPQG